ncbi:MAG: nuclear transport factor 2 family protein [Croceivirga sp.]
MRRIVLVLVSFWFAMGYAQMTTIKYEANGSDSLVAQNPFKNFIGEWTLKDNSWTQNWGGATETISIPYHHTVSTSINTANTLFSIIDGPQPNGHIFWSYNPVTKTVNHLSSFGELRAGVGEGSVSENGDVTLKITFEGEPNDTYRIYTYKWLDANSYHMKSVQHDLSDTPTGLLYEGTFIRQPKEPLGIRTQIEAVLSILDDNEISVEEQLKVYADDVVHMAPQAPVHIGKEVLGQYLKQQRQYGEAKMTHRIVEIESFQDIIVMRGEVTGVFYPENKAPSITFKTKNLFVFALSDGALKIKKVIYNNTPLE